MPANNVHVSLQIAISALLSHGHTHPHSYTLSRSGDHERATGAAHTEGPRPPIRGDPVNVRLLRPHIAALPVLSGSPRYREVLADGANGPSPAFLVRGDGELGFVEGLHDAYEWTRAAEMPLRAIRNWCVALPRLGG